MGKGTFQALGNEQINPSSPLFRADLAAIAIFFVLFIILLANPRIYSTPPASILGGGWLLIGLISLGFALWFTAYSIALGQPELWQVSYSDENADGRMEIRYSALGNSNNPDLKTKDTEKKFVVKRVRPFYEPLFRDTPWTGILVKGTVCSLRIYPVKGQFILLLGFTSLDEMKRLISELTISSQK